MEDGPDCGKVLPVGLRIEIKNEKIEEFKALTDSIRTKIEEKPNQVLRK